MHARGHDVLDQRGVGRPGLAGAAHEPLRRPLGLGAMALWHVLGHGGVAAASAAAGMAGHAPALVQKFHGIGRHSRLKLLFHQLIGDRVVVPVDLHVVVHVHAHRFPFGVLVGPRRQRPHRRTVQRLEQLTSATGQLLERPRIERLEPLANGLVGRCQTNWIGPIEASIEGSQAASWRHSARAAVRYCLKTSRRVR